MKFCFAILIIGFLATGILAQSSVKSEIPKGMSVITLFYPGINPAIIRIEDKNWSRDSSGCIVIEKPEGRILHILRNL